MMARHIDSEELARVVELIRTRDLSMFPPGDYSLHCDNGDVDRLRRVAERIRGERGYLLITALYHHGGCLTVTYGAVPSPSLCLAVERAWEEEDEVIVCHVLTNGVELEVAVQPRTK